MRKPLSVPALSLLIPLLAASVLAPSVTFAQGAPVTVPPITATETTKATTQGISETTSTATQPQPETTQPKK